MSAGTENPSVKEVDYQAGVDFMIQYFRLKIFGEFRRIQMGRSSSAIDVASTWGGSTVPASITKYHSQFE